METKSTVIKLGDEEKILCYDWAAFYLIESELGASPLAVSKELQELLEADPHNLPIVKTTKLLWAGLRHSEPNITIEEVMALIHPTFFGQIIEKIVEGLALSLDVKLPPKKVATPEKKEKATG